MSDAVTTKPKQSPPTITQPTVAQSMAAKYANSPYRDPVAYLLEHGWEPTIDPHIVGCRWLDPQGALVASTQKVPILVPVAEGSKEMKQLLIKVEGRTIPAERVHIVGERLPLSRAEAFAVQQAREAKGA